MTVSPVDASPSRLRLVIAASDRRFARSRICASRAWKPSSSVLNNRAAAVLAAAGEQRPRDRQDEECPQPGSVLAPLLGVGREITFEGAAHLLAVVAQRAQRLVDLLGEHRWRERVRLARHGTPAGTEDPLGTAEHEERRATGDGRGLDRAALDLRRDVDRGASRGLEDLQLLAERRASR